MSDEAIGKAAGLGEGLFSTLIDLMPNYFSVLDSEAQVVYVNQTAADYLDLPKHEIVGKSFKDIEPDRRSSRPIDQIAKIRDRLVALTGGGRVKHYG